MGLYDSFPYTNFHELNLRWVLETCKQLKSKTEDIDTAVSLAQTYAEAAALSATQLANSFITPQMFGAVGDGITDDTEALKEMFADGRSVFIPHGTYLLTDKVTANSRAVYGGGGVIKWQDTEQWTDAVYSGGSWHYTTKDAIYFNGIPNLSINNLIFISDKDNADILTWNGLVLHDCNDAKITNCTVIGFNWCGISITDSERATVSDNTLLENRYGLYVKADNTVNNSNIISGLFSQSHEYAVNGAWISNSTFDSKYYDGIIVYGENNIFSNNLLYDNGQSGIYSNSAKNLQIENNFVFENFNCGIDMGATTNRTEIAQAVITGNNVINNKSHQINLKRVNYSVINSNNVIITDNANTAYGIILTTAETTKNVISENKVFISANNSNRAISLDNDVTYNNIIFNTLEAPLLMNTTYQSSNIVVKYDDVPYLMRSYVNHQENVAAGSSITVDLSDYMTLDTQNKAYIINIFGTNRWWHYIGVLYPAGTGGGGAFIEAIKTSQISVTVSGSVLTISNDNASYASLMRLTVKDC